MTRIVAIVPTFNRVDHIGTCLRSLSGQSRPLDQIVVVDDGSNDGTSDYLCENFGNIITLYRTANGGKSAALNFALERSESDFVWICDDDDIAMPDACENLLAGFDNADEAVGFTFGHYRVFDRTDGELQIHPPSFWASPDEEDVRISVLEDLHIFQFATLFRRSALDTAGRFDETLRRSQDLEMMIRITRQYRGLYVPHTIFFQRTHERPLDGTHQSAMASEHEKWLEYDLKFFPALAGSDRDFTPSFATDYSSERKKRAQAMQKSVVFGRRGLWDLALKFLADAIEADSETALQPEEIRLAERMIRHGLPSGALSSDLSELARFAELRRSGRVGATICNAVATALLQRMRQAFSQKRWVDALRASRMAFHVGGVGFPYRFLIERRERKIRSQSQRSRPSYSRITDRERLLLKKMLADSSAE